MTTPSAGTAQATPRRATPEEEAIGRELRQATDREYRRHRRLRARDLALAVLTPLALLLLWQIAVLVGALDSRLVPPPSQILTRGWEMAADGDLWVHVGATLPRLASGFLLGAVAGIAVGLVMGVWRPVRAALGPTFTALYALPKIATLPLLLLVFGLTETPKILSVAISVFFVLQINTLTGIARIDARVLEAARAYGASGWRLFRYVLLPGATPSIMTGLRVAAGMAVIVVTAVEFVASNNGLGFLIWNSWQLFQPQTMFVGLIAVSVIGASMTGLFILLERALLPWQNSGSPRKKGKNS